MTEEATTPASPARRRAGRGSGSIRVAPSTTQYRNLKHRFAPTPMVSEDELEAIHNASLTILEEMGMDFMHEEARAILKKAGADVKAGSERVRFDRNMILEAIKTCPSEFTLHARNPERKCTLAAKTWPLPRSPAHPMRLTCKADDAQATSKTSAIWSN